ncbi:MAG: AI-2E family transporter [Aquificae bacterium]|nr:AI-2E family transporter [Aquificota bacterium]
MDEFRRRIFTYGFLLTVFVIFLLVVYMLLPFWQPITLAVISAVVFYPVFRFFKRFLFSDLLAAGLTLAVVVSLVVVPFLVAAFLFSQEVAKLLTNLQRFVQEGGIDLLVKDLQQKLYVYLYSVQSKYPFLGEVLNEENLKGFLAQLYSFLSGYFTSLTKEAVIWLGGAAFGLFVYLLTLFFALYQGKAAVEHARRLLPLEERDKEEILKTIYNAVTGVIYGTVGTAVVQSFVALALYAYYGLPYPFLWALVTALFAFIPPFGTGYVWFPLTLYELFFVDTFKGLVGLAVGFLVISSIDNFVRPLIMKERIELPYVVLFFAVVGGLLAFGFTGLFLGPTIFALFVTLLRLYERKLYPKG